MVMVIVRFYWIFLEEMFDIKYRIMFKVEK